MEKTYVMIKPHFANYNSVVYEIKKRLSRLGLKIIDESFLKYSKEDAKKHYAEHVNKPFYPELENYITSEKVLGIILEGPDAIAKVRSIIGSSIKKNKETGELILPELGTIRRDIAQMLGEECHQTKNVVHASDSPESAKKEIKIFKEIIKRQQLQRLE